MLRTTENRICCKVVPYLHTQAVVPILNNDTEDSLSERILRQEHKIYSRAIQLYAEGRLKIEGRRVTIVNEKTMTEEFLINP